MGNDRKLFVSWSSACLHHLQKVKLSSLNKANSTDLWEELIIKPPQQTEFQQHPKLLWAQQLGFELSSGQANSAKPRVDATPTVGMKPFSISALQLLEGVRDPTHRIHISRPLFGADDCNCAQTHSLLWSPTLCNRQWPATVRLPIQHTSHRNSPKMLHATGTSDFLAEHYSLQPQRRRHSKSPNLTQRLYEQ